MDHFSEVLKPLFMMIIYSQFALVVSSIKYDLEEPRGMGSSGA